jgi:hypothetical protein
MHGAKYAGSKLLVILAILPWQFKSHAVALHENHSHIYNISKLYRNK